MGGGVVDATRGAHVEESSSRHGAETAKTKNGVEVRKQQEHESTTVGILCWRLMRFGVHLYFKDFQLFSAAL